MQQCTKPTTQIHLKGPGLIQLMFAGQCVGFAVSYRSAGHVADQLDQLFSLIPNRSVNSGVDATSEVSFGSMGSEKCDISGQCPVLTLWVVEAKDGTPIRFFTSEKVARWFRDAVETYDEMRPPTDEGGEWSTAQIDWFRNHPAPMASACGGSLTVRKLGVH
ncbi:hypothetical protein LGQ10_29655 [Pseudomonas sp. L5B5]|uniref:hypothetical protein n=1 Tax=Pseudomonas sp. L5B5 TaxID=2883205 RepID=UPI001CFB116B|nr:hypothetical protein [Pseudomonas sp. L5B5]UCZ84431.1 hypothetical protein LGQ10_29655 [Pseudomonas sp. L5B5]